MKPELRDKESTNGFPVQTTWEWIKQYVNTETEVVRTDLVYYASITEHNLTTMENYRAELSYAGYLSKANGTGRYTVLKPIPEHYTTVELRKDHHAVKQVEWARYVDQVIENTAMEKKQRAKVVKYEKRQAKLKWIPLYGLFTYGADQIMKTRTNAKRIYFMYQLICYIALMLGGMAYVTMIYPT